MWCVLAVWELRGLVLYLQPKLDRPLLSMEWIGQPLSPLGSLSLAHYHVFSQNYLAIGTEGGCCTR